MKLNIDQSHHVAKSILLEESGNPFILRLTVIFSSLILLSFFIWAMNMNIDEIAVAPGEIVPTGKVQNVQHLDGGIIKEILVKDGDMVRKDEVLMLLDPFLDQSQYDYAESESKELELKRQNFIVQKKSIDREIKMRRKLVRKGLFSEVEFLSLQRKQNEIIASLSEIPLQLNKIEDKKKVLLHKINLMKISAPSSGVVHGLTAHTVGGVVAAGDTIMKIVPGDRELVAEVQIFPRDVGHVNVGQEVIVKFTTFDFSRYGGIRGTLTEISATTFQDDTGMPYYKGVISFSEGSGETRFGIDQVLTGMTVQADIRTGSKTVMEYLLKPIFSSSQSALRER